MFLILFLYVLGTILFAQGYIYDAKTGIVTIERMKYFHSFMDMPLLLGVLLLGVVTLLYGIYIAVVKNAQKAIWFTGAGTIITVFVLLFVLGVNHSVYYPSLADLQSSLTIENSSGSYYTLSVMAVVSLLVPVVAGYIFYVWKAMDKTKLTIDEIKNDPHHY
jgi:cytochrome d ubiquinol oxidase subunit II